MQVIDQSANSPERTIVTWKPDYDKRCAVCDGFPVVTGVDENGVEVYPTKLWARDFNNYMCGVCTWGEAACIDPENW
jgi:hypothetical protein